MSADQLLSFREQGGIRCDDQEVGNDVVNVLRSCGYQTRMPQRSNRGTHEK